MSDSEDRATRRAELSAITGRNYHDPDPKMLKTLRKLVKKHGRGAVSATLAVYVGGPWSQAEYEEIADG